MSPRCEHGWRTPPSEEVPDCDAGPRRVAAELGTVALPAGGTTVRPDGRPDEPVEVCVVVSRYETTGERRQMGISVSRSVASLVRALFVAARGGRARRPAFDAPAATVRERPRIHPERWLIPSAAGSPGPSRVHGSTFLPAEAHKKAVAALRGQSVPIDAEVPPRHTPAAHPLVGAVRPALRTARPTWTRRVGRYAASAGTTAALTMVPRCYTVELSAFQ
jgi:hypothetical protein